MTIINENAVKTLKIIVNDSKTNKATKNEQQVNQITNPYPLNSYLNVYVCGCCFIFC